ncbi:MAG TPA: ABC transporter ATP-binding protein [Acidimicrobiales bacterium]
MPEPVAAGPPTATDHLLEVDDVNVEFVTRRGTVQAVRGVSFHLDAGETLGLVGESGSGKSVTSQAILGLVELPGRIVGGDIRWKGRSLLGDGNAAYARSIRGKELAVVFQDPMTSLNPLFTVGMQLGEVLRHHMGMSRRQATERSVELLDLVGISFPRQRVKQYPHELSGGMRQRVIIAMALACEPELIIADEPTTALDVTIQAQILDLIADLQQRLGLAVLLITHDLGVVAGLCHRLQVMYAGRLVESGGAGPLFDRPGHPYTAGLLRSTPRLDVVHRRLVAIDGAPPDPHHPPPGCAFHPRCALATERCATDDPPTVRRDDGRSAVCFRAFDVPPGGQPDDDPSGGEGTGSEGTGTEVVGTRA